MNPLLSLKDEDIFPKDFLHELKWNEPTERVAVRIIAIDKDGNIALCGTKYKLLPGGGIEEGENLEEAARRECLEEIGCRVEIGKYIGYTDETRDSGKRHQITHCFIAKVIGEKGAPQSLQDDEKGMKVFWYTLDEALEILKEQVKSIPFESYNSCFNVRTHFAFLNFYKENNASR